MPEVRRLTYAEAVNAALTRAGARLFAEGIAELARLGVTTVLSGVKRGSPMADTIGEWTSGFSHLRDFSPLDEAIEWAEDQIIYGLECGADDYLAAGQGPPVRLGRSLCPVRAGRGGDAQRHQQVHTLLALSDYDRALGPQHVG